MRGSCVLESPQLRLFVDWRVRLRDYLPLALPRLIKIGEFESLLVAVRLVWQVCWVDDMDHRKREEKDPGTMQLPVNDNNRKQEANTYRPSYCHWSLTIVGNFAPQQNWQTFWLSLLYDCLCWSIAFLKLRSSLRLCWGVLDHEYVVHSPVIIRQ